MEEFEEWLLNPSAFAKQVVTISSWGMTASDEGAHTQRQSATRRQPCALFKTRGLEFTHREPEATFSLFNGQRLALGVEPSGRIKPGLAPLGGEGGSSVAESRRFWQVAGSPNCG